ncbi:Catabolite control protein A [Streptomyces sp. YIM 130001]|uniref:LacI family DNA-binding transcriptional regulator n=1 Tax=Streptomyces sp. YIM 130001 TaxID=2259644 RepID=UPI000E650BD9|nr:LacI family DNA-binding transcriptional regulator [Streptomyces sp. YIM 130001]RII17881.1 Catabolite control protein A [Streptomyces sp. YIM 130001]
MASPRRRPTQVDIARRLGISQATVSLVVSGGPASFQVAEHTRRAVLEAAAELGYTVNAAARSLKGGRNRLLGLYTFEPVFPVDRRDFYFPFLLGVEEATAACGYDLLLFSSATARGDRSIYASGANRLKVADGCVLLGRDIDRAELAELVREDFPFVFIGRREVPGHELSYVAPDNVAATRNAVLHLAGFGHRSMAYLKMADDQEPTRDRAEGFRQGIADVGIGADQVLVHATDEPVTGALLREWLTDGITALLVEPSEDDAAIASVERAAAEAGILIPEDCSVVLLGDPPPSESTRDWTRYRPPREQMAREAVRLLLELLDDEDGRPRHLLLGCRPIPGESVAEPTVSRPS